MEVRVEYYWHGKSGHKWEHPCVAEIECDVSTTDNTVYDNSSVWIIAAIVGSILVAIALIIFCIVYAMKNFSGSGKVDDDGDD